MAIALPIKLFLVFLLATQKSSATRFSHIRECFTDQNLSEGTLVLSLKCSDDHSKPDISDQIKTDQYITCERSVDVATVTHVQYADCEMDKLPADMFRRFYSLRSLNYSFLSIKSIEETVFSEINAIKELDLSHNQLELLDWSAFEWLDKLESLNLANNQITTFTNQMPNQIRKRLNKIDLSENNIRSISDIFSFSHDFSLKVLILSRNVIDSLKRDDFVHLPDLEYLDLSNTYVRQIEMGTFAPLNQLTHLDLSKNGIATLDFDLFLPAMRHLSNLFLDDNILTELTNHTDQLFPRLTKLRISQNQFNCSYLREFLFSLRIGAAAVEVNQDYTTENMRGIGCAHIGESEPGMELGLTNWYRVTIVVSVLIIVLTNLVIVFIMVIKKTIK